MSSKEMFPADQSPELAEWQERVLARGPHSPYEAIVHVAARQIAEIAVRYNLTPDQAFENYFESRRLATDPRFRRSMEQWEAGELIDITPSRRPS